MKSDLTTNAIRSEELIPTDRDRDCPFGTIHQKQCDTCKLGVQLFTDEEAQAKKSKGAYTAINKQYTCIFILLAQSLQSEKK